MVIKGDGSFEASGMGETTQFKMKSSAMAFKILSNSLYKDKIGAIVRELACNALDSHKFAGKEDIPFEIYCPTYLDPHFRIRDYGTGLSEEDVMTIYCTYFESTKTQTNDLIGCFGLGSKTPFSYADTFTINSYFNGVKYNFCAYLDANGMPNVSKLLEEETEEENGIEVTIAVEAKDIHNFQTAFKKFLMPFENIKTNIEIPKFKYMFEMDDFAVIERDTGSYESKSINKKIYMRQGNIVYPLDLELADISTKKVIFGGTTSRYAILINMPIGSLEVTPSREELGYDYRTKKAIQDKIYEINDKFTQKLQAFYDDAVAQSDSDEFTYCKLFSTEILRYKKMCLNLEEVAIKTVDGQIATASAICGMDITCHNTKFYYSDKLKSGFRRKSSEVIECNKDSVYAIMTDKDRAIPASNVTVFFSKLENRDKDVRFIYDRLVPAQLRKYCITVAMFKEQYKVLKISVPKLRLKKSSTSTYTKVSVGVDEMYVKKLGDTSYDIVPMTKLLTGCFIGIKEFPTDTLKYFDYKCLGAVDPRLINVYLLNSDQVKIAIDAGIPHYKKVVVERIKTISEAVLDTQIYDAVAYNSEYKNTFRIVERINEISPRKFKKVSAIRNIRRIGIEDISSFGLFLSKLGIEVDQKLFDKMKDTFQNRLNAIKKEQQEFMTLFSMFTLVDRNIATSPSESQKKIMDNYINLILRKKC